MEGEGCRAEVAERRRRAFFESVKFVYVLQSLVFPDRHYVGVTHDIEARLKLHNAGEVSHTSKFAPWRIKTYVAFSDDARALAFERYLKSPSGRALAKKRL